MPDLKRCARTWALLCGALLLWWSGSALAADGAAQCRALLTQNFARVADAPTMLSSAALVPAGADGPEHCLVEAYVARNVGVQMALPTHDWNGKFLMQGCGGSCGVYSLGGCSDALARGYAVSTTDMGHKGGAMSSWHWAYNNREGEIDFGYRATHVGAVASKALLAAFYGQTARYSYFRGCSTGGRQGMVEAQRYPHDFDGIMAGAPPLDETGDGVLHLMWSARAALDASGKPVLSPADIGLAHAAVLAACDAADGLRDGLIQDPAGCHWDPASIECPVAGSSGGPAACLSPAAVAAMRKMYDGARDRHGRQLLRGGGMPRGSEYTWVPMFVDSDGGPSQLLAPGNFADQILAYLSFYDDPGPGYSSSQFDFDRDPPRMASMEALFSAKNPDLRDFRDGGGKLLLYWGWDDPASVSGMGIDYYRQVTALMGGTAATQEFFRLFMVPGMSHCRRGPGEAAIDYLTYLEQWVEHGRAPASLLAYHLKHEQAFGGIPPVVFPLRLDDYTWSRPLYPYPAVAHWSGKGDPNRPDGWTILQAPRQQP